MSDQQFVSGSTDATAKLWDFREPKGCIMSFGGSMSDINAVDVFPDGQSFATAGDDSTARLYDVRSSRQMQEYRSESILCGSSSVACSSSGKYLFAGYDDYKARVWDTVTGSIVQHLDVHKHRVTCLGLQPDGQALCTGSWDTNLALWCGQ
eukprot:CAMPEP_0170200798 /NCGR_PEP_ID=MMETSP0040_2-20121228/70052_1 /TAXON_ID=641309 /ORGANISM="Lotharella oceanica, Strain CCMP622" /LENGTH=150 /DNA_ID=CAMNT_0010450987 /DNA_START=401 /DNA_END=853 /DNA_ORIENTATION=+